MRSNEKRLGIIAGKNLKILIKNSDIKTQEKFAYNFGVDIRTVNRWINLGIDSLYTIQQIANFFDEDVFNILKENNNK